MNAGSLNRSGKMDTQHGVEAEARSLLPSHRTQLHQSGLTDETINKSGVFSVLDESEARRLLNRGVTAPAPAVPALAFPYSGAGQYSRLRVDEPGDGPKYLAPTGVTSKLYFPDPDFLRRLAADETSWLLEGEKKALAAMQAGLLAVAAPGVWSYGDVEANRAERSAGEERLALHPDLAKLSLAGRRCAILFDSDIDTNPKVLKAAVRTGNMLKHVGAAVFISYIPGATGRGEKVGLDDYYARLPMEERAGVGALRAVTDAVRPFDPTDCIEQFITPRWRSWSPEVREQELRRVVLLAAELLGGVAFKAWTAAAARTLGLKAGDVRSLLPPREEARSDAMTWVREWLANHDVKYEMGTERVRLNGEDVTSVHLFQRMALDADAFGGPRPQYLNYALDIWTDEQRRLVISKCRDLVRFTPSNPDVLGRWVQAVTGKDESVVRAVMAHFLWQVKRKLFGLSVEHHMMPILHGGQGCGKTTAISKLVAPLGDLCDSPGDLQMLGDSREAFRLHRAYIVFFDEMAKAGRMDVDTLKNRITQETLRWRALSMNRVAAGRNNATFIGATNTALTDLIYDPTGIRRFFQVECQSPCDWESLNALDYAALWRDVDENGPAPVLPFLDAVKQHQEQLRPKDAVEEFLADWCKVGGGEWTGAKTVYESFKEFLADDMRADKWSSSRFGRRLKGVLDDDQVKVSNGTKYNLSILRQTATDESLDALIEQTAAKVANEPMKKSA